MSFVVRKARTVREPLSRTAISCDREEVLACAPYFRWKSLMSRFCAALLMIPGLPLTGLLILLVRLTSRGPGLYRQVRVGYQGKPFMLYKIRTMRVDAETTTGPVWTDRHDPRITWLGQILRRVHLDELPQLLNVLRGEMTLIGPRPERPEFTQFLAREIPGYMDRYLVLPGITGLAQINLPPDTDTDSVRRKLVLDLEYVAKATFLMDVRILLCTSLRLWGLPGLRIARWLGLARDPQIPAHMIREPSPANGVPATYCAKITTSAHGSNGKAGASKKGGLPAS